MFSACTSIKVAVLLNKVSDLPKEHSALSTSSFTVSFFFSGFRAAAVGTCSQCRLVPALSHVLLCSPMSYSLPGSSLHGIFQASIPEWAIISFSRDLPDPGIKPKPLSSPALVGRFFCTAPAGKPIMEIKTVKLLWLKGDLAKN